MKSPKLFFLLSLTTAILFFNILFISTAICEGGFESGFIELAEIYAQEGYANRKRGNIREAIKYQQKATYLNPKFAFPHNELGVLYESKGWLDRAEKAYKEAIRIDPQFLSAYMNLALLYESKGQIEEAVYHWKKRIELAPRKDRWTTLSIEKLNKYAPDELFSIVNPRFIEEISALKRTEQKIPLEVKEEKRVTLKTKPVKERIERDLSVFEYEKMRQAEKITEEMMKKIERDVSISKQRRVNTLIESAREFLKLGEFESALDKLHLAQSLEPKNIEIELLISAARSAQLESQRRK